ncbi:vacuolar protein [Kwoniella mangroviensis CBS 10435]|uniref:Vacuolar protein n=1 Tax=Kwoniella mangroviensis CBS 10435 TaxID=1331196 RepID=A0A1B9INP5_9TREE|nr:vacuolar protein [Kwoniella mangroviensis CBS 10435]OCF72754.1 vacuolar protein [Kwoniella mangroviensis CBS 8886]
MRYIALLSLLTGVSASQHSLKLPEPTRQLEWKDVNFLSTSDIHGWLLGHQHATWPEPNYSGDYGSLASFATHMRRVAHDKGVDLLLVDAGDHHDGSGLVSSSSDAAGKAEDIFSMLPYDIITIGNHELYHYEDALEEYRNKGRWNGRYVTSNVNITIRSKDGSFQSVPLGEQYLKLDTEQGRKVTAFGIIFNCKGISIQKPSKLAKEPWFLEAIKDKPDYFVLAGHMPARGETAEFGPIFDAIREAHPKVPIYIFGGHTHVRDCVQYDDRSIGVVPGRYLETVAFTSSSLPQDDDEKPLDVARRYIDGNPVSYKWHTNTSDEEFDLPIGRNISLALLRLASNLNISTPLGIAPHDYFLERHPYGHPRSVLTVFSDQVLPHTIFDKERNETRVIIGNAGSLRFDLFQGRFDRNDELTVSPFTSKFLYVQLPAGLARNITEQMNKSGASKLLPSEPTTKSEEEDRVRRTYNEWMAEQWEDYLTQGGDDHLYDQVESQRIFKDDESDIPKKPRTMGFVTKDSCPGKGDDIEHYPVPHVGNQPDFVQTPFPDVNNDEIIDVVSMDFALDDFLAAVNVLDPAIDLKEAHMKPYAEGLEINVVFGMYAKEMWQAGL